MARPKSPNKMTKDELKAHKTNLKQAHKNHVALGKEVEAKHKAAVAEANKPVAEAEKAYKVAHKALGKASAAAKKVIDGLNKKHEKHTEAHSTGLNKIAAAIEEANNVSEFGPTE